MDSIKLEAMDNYKSSCLKNHPNTNNAFFAYIMTALICSLVFFIPLWYPSFESLIITFPNIISSLATPKCLFIVGNLIVFVLVGESKLLTSKPSKQATDKEYYHEYLSRSQSDLKQCRPTTFHSEYKELREATRSLSCNGRLTPVRKVELIKGNKKEVYCSTNKGPVVRSLSAVELSKRADDFIARVNRQRRLEAYSSC